MKQIRGLPGEEYPLKCSTVKYGIFIFISTTSLLLIEYTSTIFFRLIYIYHSGIWGLFSDEMVLTLKPWHLTVSNISMCSLQCDCLRPANFPWARAQERNLALHPASSLPATGRLYRMHTFMEVCEGAYAPHATECVSWVTTRKLTQKLYLKHLHWWPSNCLPF